MRKAIYILFALMCITKVNATNYYLSNIGSDLQDGKTEMTAWMSMSKLLSVIPNLQPGDSVLFKCNDTFHGQLQLLKSGNKDKNIYFGSYGSGNKPVLSGVTTISNWTSVGNNIWEATCNECGNTVNNFFINNIPQQLGRWPNANDPNRGYLSYESHSGTNQITDKQLSDDINWTGADAVVRRVRWILDRLTIKSQNAGTLIFTTNTSYGFNDGYGYFIENDPRTLDLQGEWAFNSAKKKFSLYSTFDPNTVITEAAQMDFLLKISGQKYITIENLRFYGSNNITADITNCSNITFKNSEVYYSGLNGINIDNTGYFVFAGNLINYTNNNAFTMNNSSNSSVRNNVIKNTGIIAGLGLGGDGQYNAVHLGGSNITFEKNRVDSIGYIGVSSSGPGIVIKNNYISNYCMTKDDGGGIYGGTNFKVIGNILMNGHGVPEGTTGGVAAEGIYIDDRSGYVDIIDNTVYNCGNSGIKIHNANHINIKRNIVYNNNTQLLMSHDNIASTFPITDCAIDSNIFVSKEASQVVAAFETIDNGISEIGTFDYNYYCRPMDDNLIINTSYVNGTTFRESNTFESWASKFNEDKHSGKSPIQIEPYKVIKVKSSNLIFNSTFSNSTINWSNYSNYNNSKMIIANSGSPSGKALFASFKTPSGKTDGNMLVITNNVPFDKEKSYQFKFLSKGSLSDVSVRFLPRQNGGSYGLVADERFFSLGTSFKQYEFLLEPFVTEKSSRIDFSINEGQGDFWLDNVELAEVDVNKTNADDYILFEFNGTNNYKSINIGADYVDVKGKPISGQVILKPYTSIILFKDIKTSSEPNPEISQSQILILPNPAINQVTVKSTDDICAIYLYNINGQLLQSYKVPGEQEYTINHLPPPGLYLVHIQTKNRTECKKLLIRD